MLYATLTAIRSYLGLLPSQTKDDDRLLFFLQSSSSFIDLIRRCDVRKETRSLNCPSLDYQRAAFGSFDVASWVTAFNSFNEVARGRLRLDDDLLAATLIVNGDGTTVAESDYVLNPANNYPKASIYLKSSSGLSWKPDGSDHRQVIAVTGWWGYHKKYNKAFVSSLDAVKNDPLTSGSTAITVGDADGIAADLRADRFQAGTLIKIEDELCYVITRDAATNIVTVARGFNGTTAVAHVKETPIYIYRFHTDIELATIRLAVWRYRQKDANTFDKTTILATGEQIVPSSLPPDVRDLLPKPRGSFKDNTQ